MSFYLEVNGVPACLSALTLDREYTLRTIEKTEGPACEGTEAECSARAEILRELFPEAQVEVINDYCPAPDKYDDYDEGEEIEPL